MSEKLYKVIYYFLNSCYVQGQNGVTNLIFQCVCSLEHQRVRTLPRRRTLPTGLLRPLDLAHLEAVLVQVALLREGAVALRADEVFAVRRVDQHVRAEVGLVSERLAAAGVLADVRPLTGVRPHVAFEQP